MAELKWEEIKSSGGTAKRAKIHGGWLVLVNYTGDFGLTFVPDSKHEWK